jgi:hypothetical protein
VIYFFRILFTELKILLKAKKIGYYTSIEDIPIFNWDKIENGKYKYLFKSSIKRDYLQVPKFFSNIISEMFYQFEKVNMTMIEKRHKLAYLTNLYVTTKRVDFLNKSRHLKAEIDRLEKEQSKQNRSTLNEKVNLIETTFSSIGSIDVKKMSASRFYSLLYLAIKTIEDGYNKER